MVDKLNPNELYYGQRSDGKRFEQPLAINQLSQPYATIAQKEAHLEQTYALMNNGEPLTNRMVMVNPTVMKGREERIGIANGVEDHRFTTQEAKNIKDQVFTGLKGFSRFYTNKFVSPETIAADIGATAFTNTSNSNPRGDSIMVDGSTPFVTPNAEDIRNESTGAPEKTLTLTEYEFDVPKSRATNDYYSLI